MSVAFFHDGPLYRDTEGKLYNGVLSDEIIGQYRPFGSPFTAVTRIRPAANPDPAEEIKNPDFVSVEVQDINTVSGRLFSLKKCKQVIQKKVCESDYVIARVPSSVGQLAVQYALKYRKPLLTEVVGCPWDSYWNHSLKGKFLAPVAALSMKRLVARSTNVLYVTDAFLQRRYPTGGRSIGCSDIVLYPRDREMLTERIQRIRDGQKSFVLGTCGVLDVKYKGQEYVIKALARLKKKGYAVRYQLVGGGSPERLLKIAEKYGVREQVEVLGTLPHEKIGAWLSELDIYIQPSDTEGLCRALIEAMSAACPCLASDAGGNPELLSGPFIFKKKNVLELTEKLERLLLHPEACERAAEENFEKAGRYELPKLSEKRKNFYEGMFGEDHQEEKI